MQRVGRCDQRKQQVHDGVLHRRIDDTEHESEHFPNRFVVDDAEVAHGEDKCYSQQIEVTEQRGVDDIYVVRNQRFGYRSRTPTNMKGDDVLESPCIWRRKALQLICRLLSAVLD